MKTITIRISLDELLASGKDITIHIDRQGYASVVPSVTQQPTCNGRTLFSFMEELIKRKKECQRTRTSETYSSTLRSFRRFRHDEDILLSDIDETLTSAYEGWMRAQGLKPNTTSFYMRVLRAAYNRSVRDGLTDNRHPFRNVYTGIAKTVKRAVDVDVIRRLEALDVDDKEEQMARDLFLFSFYTQGMSFVDMAYLKTSDLTNGTLVYNRKKTGSTITVRWTPEMQRIVDRQPAMTAPYLLPIIRSSGGKERSQMRYCQYIVNSTLKKLSERMGLPHPITMYTSRHSWATIARSIGTPIEVISKGMGHSSERTTHIYLQEIDSGHVAEANRQIIRLLEGGIRPSSSDIICLSH